MNFKYLFSFLIFWTFIFSNISFAQILFKGTVQNSVTSSKIQGVTLHVIGSTNKYVTDQNGSFSINVQIGDSIRFNFLGYEPFTYKVGDNLNVIIKLVPMNNLLEEVTIINTGYQKMALEKTTGSYTFLPSNVLERPAGKTLLERLDGIAPGILFDKNQQGNNQAFASVRGRSTIFGDPNPLIVLDDFPFEGDINTINPNDVESITILKDAAASSLWGTRAGNGVIIITTKSGKISSPTINLSIGFGYKSRPDLFGVPQISTKDYIEIQEFLYSKSYYNSSLRSPYNIVPEVAVILNQVDNGFIDISRANSMLDSMKMLDVRNDLQKYLYQNQIDQQYNLNIQGGSSAYQYYLSGGFDNNQSNRTMSRAERITLNTKQSLKWFDNRLELDLGLSTAISLDRAPTSSYSPYEPYDMMTDQEGNPVNVSKGIRASYADTVGLGYLLDWTYNPINDYGLQRNIYNNNRTSVNLQTKALIFKNFRVSASYQYSIQKDNREMRASEDSHYARDLVNRYTVVNRTTGVIKNNVPYGSVIDRTFQDRINHQGRLQGDYNVWIGENIKFQILGGFELGDYRSNYNTYRLYGYDESTRINGNSHVNFADAFPLYYNPSSSSRIPTGASSRGTIDQFRSVYSTSTLSWVDQIIFTGSVRKDESNLFGVASNRKGVPLWSSGLLLNLHKFLNFNQNKIDKLQFKTTYGITGNVDKSTSALLTAKAGLALGGLNFWGSNYSEIVNPPNPSLRWERVEKLNFGVSLSSLSNRLHVDFDYFIHNGKDLIGNNPQAPQTGISQFRGNLSEMQTKGIDLVIRSQNIKSSNFNWSSSILFNWQQQKITKFLAAKNNNMQIIESNWSNPLEGYPYNSIFSFPWGSLDNTGKPQVLINDVPSLNYSQITNVYDPDLLEFNGSGTPTYFGSVINDFSMGNFNLNFNIRYKFGYFFRRLNVFSGTNYSWGQSHYEDRWQKPGDEYFTYIPALTFPNVSNMANFYRNSSVLVDRGDHLRLQDIQLSYNNLQFQFLDLKMKAMTLTLRMDGGWVIWKANKNNIDPDYLGYGNPKKYYSFGIKTFF